MAPARNLHINAQNKERANLHLSPNELLEAPMFLELIKAQDFTIILLFFFWEKFSPYYLDWKKIINNLK